MKGGISNETQTNPIHSNQQSRLRKLMDQLLKQRGIQTFEEFVQSHVMRSVAAGRGASQIGRRIKRRESFDHANEINGEHVQIDFIINFQTKQIEMETELTDEGIDVELTLLNLHYYGNEGEQLPDPVQSKIS